MTDRIVQYHSDRYNSEINSDVSMLTEDEKKLIRLSMNKEWTNPKFKLRWFVGQAQITPFAKFRQWLLEIKSKEESIENMEYELAKLDLEKDRFIRIRDTSTDDLDRRGAEIELWNNERMMYTTKRRLQDWYLERQHLIDLLNEFLASDEAKLKDGSGRTYMDIMNTDEEDTFEAEIWTNRLAKQAACDMMFYGRINSGNMDAILSMSPEQQADTLNLAINFGTQLQQYTNQIQRQVDKELGLNAPNADHKELLFPQQAENLLPEAGTIGEPPSKTGDMLNVYNV
jgi:hypothetical protein